MSSTIERSHSLEKLQGVKYWRAALKYWRQDLFAGFVASSVLIGIALASGAPSIAVLLFLVIISGIIAVFLGGTHITISGPAAGLAPAIYGANIQLGHGDVAIGCPLSFLKQQAEKSESLIESEHSAMRLLNIRPEQISV